MKNKLLCNIFPAPQIFTCKANMIKDACNLAALFSVLGAFLGIFVCLGMPQ